VKLGIPTANLPVDTDHSPSWLAEARSGVYFGWASLALPSTHPDDHSHASSSSSPSPQQAPPPPPPQQQQQHFQLFPMVMSIGYNPFYKNRVRSAEVHVLHRFAADFYGAQMRLLILGFVREEKDYAGLEALVADINFDCEVARRSLERPGWRPRGLAAAGRGEGEGEGEGEGAAEGVERVQGGLDGSWLLRPLGA
jgi:riboflavin kinase